MGAVGVEMKAPTIFDACGCGDGDANATCGPEMTTERCGDESSKSGELDRGGVPFNRILRSRPRRRCVERREIGWADIDLGRATSVLCK